MRGRYVCLYDVEERLLLRRFQVSANRSLDGVLDQLNSKTLTDAGPAALIDDPPSDDDELLPPSAAGAPFGLLLSPWSISARAVSGSVQGRGGHCKCIVEIATEAGFQVRVNTNPLDLVPEKRASARGCAASGRWEAHAAHPHAVWRARACCRPARAPSCRCRMRE